MELEAQRKTTEGKKNELGEEVKKEDKVKGAGESATKGTGDVGDSITSTSTLDPPSKKSWSAWFSSSARQLKEANSAITAKNVDGSKTHKNNAHRDDVDETASHDSEESSDDSDSDFYGDSLQQKTVHQPDHVRLYVSALLRRASNKKPLQAPDGCAQDDIWIRPKNLSSASSIAIVRARSHSISEFRHAALEVMWGEFLGSIGHDFSALSAQRSDHKKVQVVRMVREEADEEDESEDDIYNEDDAAAKDEEEKKKIEKQSISVAPKSSTVRHRRRRILASMRDRLLGKQIQHNDNHQRHHQLQHHHSKLTALKDLHSSSHTLASNTQSNIPAANITASNSSTPKTSDKRHYPSTPVDTEGPVARHLPSSVPLPARQSNLEPGITTTALRHKNNNSTELREKDIQQMVSCSQSPTGTSEVVNKNNGKNNIGRSGGDCVGSRHDCVSTERGTEETTEALSSSSSSLHSILNSKSLPNASTLAPASNCNRNSGSATKVVPTALSSTRGTPFSSNQIHHTPTSKVKSNSNFETPTSAPKVAEGYRSRLSMVVGSLRKAATTPSKAVLPPSPSKHDIDQEEYEAETKAMQEEAMKLTWQAHAEVITTSAMNGEHPCMQNFMRAPQQSAGKCWVVLKQGKLFVYPNDSKRDKDVAMDASPPLKTICLYGCSCRPMEQKNGFEIGVVKLTSDKTLNQIELSRLEVQRWVPFYTDMAEQCRVWIMAIQFSATMHRYVEKDEVH